MNNLLKSLSNVTLFSILFLIDIQLAESVREGRCPYCGGPLHYARYPRNPIGSFISLPEDYRVRQGLCCGQCRCRQLPPSCLFMGRYGAYRCAILVFLTLRQYRYKTALELSEMLGIHIRTLRRWMAYFRDIFPKSNIWKRLRGFVRSNVRDNQLPSSLVMLFMDQQQDSAKGMIRCIRFLVLGELLSIK